MMKIMETCNNKMRSAIVLALSVTYLFFVLSYVWYLPNYNLIRLGGRATINTHAILKIGSRHSNNYAVPADNSVWLEKVSKTTPETKRDTGIVLIGTVVILSSLFAAARVLPGIFGQAEGRRQGYSIFTHQYAYLSLRTFRI